MILFFSALAILNKLLTNFSDSPTYLDIKSLELTEKNVELEVVAQALAKNVLPQDFNAAVDFQEMIEKSDKTIKVSIVKQSPFVQSIRLEPKFINYLIKE